jgi:hypothetical protein
MAYNFVPANGSRIILGDLFATWVETGNPKADDWAEQPPAPAADALWLDGAWVVPPPPEPMPDWARFKRIALNSDTLNRIIASAYESAPVAAGALASALLRAESGDVSDFADAWKKITRAVDVPAEVITGFVGVATACQLPPDFVAALSPD